VRKKTRKNPEKKSLVHIEWGDAWSSGVWQNEGFGEIQHKPHIVNSIGWVVQANEKGVTIAARVAEDGVYGNVMFIPNGMIISCTTLREGTLVNKGK
jgi:hypothetical protein